MNGRLFNLVTTTVDYGPQEGFVSPPNNVNDLSRFVIGSWNVRGCVRESARLKIDLFLLEKDLHLVFLQETHLISGESQTPNYRGTVLAVLYPIPILIFVISYCFKVRSWHSISDSLCQLRASFGAAGVVTFLNVHIPCSTDKRMTSSMACSPHKTSFHIKFGRTWGL